jgi:hypothetical protein
MRIPDLSKKKVIVGIIILVILTIIVSCGILVNRIFHSPLAPAGSLPQPTPVVRARLFMPHDVYFPGNEFQVYFSAPASFSDDAWLGIVPSDNPHGSEIENSSHALDFRYLEGQTSGILTFNAIGSLGMYDLRMYDTDTNGTEITYITYKVTDLGEELYIPEATLRLPEKHFYPGQEIIVMYTSLVEFSEFPWVALVPASTPHGSEDENDKDKLDYRFLDGKNVGFLSFTAPEMMGVYDFRMNDRGLEEASVTFEVSDN